MKILKLALTTAPALKSVDYSEGAGEIICAINANNKDWGENLMQIERDRKWWHVI